MSNTVIRKEKPTVSDAGVVPSSNTAGLVDDLERLFMEQIKPQASAPRGRVDDSLMAELARIVGPGAAQPAQPAPAPRPVLPQAHDPFDPGAPEPLKSADVDPLKAFEEELKRFDSMHRAKTAPLPEPQPQPTVGMPSHDLPPPHLRTQGDHDAAAAQAVAPLPPLPGVDELRGAQPAVPARAEPDALYPVEPEPVMAPDYPPLADLPPPRNRRVVVLLGSAAAIALAGVVGAVALKGGPGRPGDAPVIAAKTQPMKEKPADPGGMEVPGQDRQVLARKVDEPKGGASVVNKEEQPVDLNQTPKREVARVVLPAPSQQGGSATPTSPPPAIMMPPGAAQPSGAPADGTAGASGGGFEAKRVKSVKVGSDPLAAPPASPSVPSMASGTSARPIAAAPAPTPAPALAPPPSAMAPAQVATAPKVDRPAASPPKSEARPTLARPAQPTTTTPGSVRPTRPAATEADGDGAPLSLRPPSGQQAARAPAAAPTTTASTGGSGGYSVQLAAPGSELEARTLVQRLKQRHSGALGSYTPTVRTAEVNGKTVYRVRVYGLSRDSANSLCSDLKADGGSCFVAGN